MNNNYHLIEPWQTSGILTSRRTKNKLNVAFLKKPSVANSTKFKNYRNLYNKVIRLAKKNYYQKKLLEYNGNLKKTWQTLFHAVGKGKKRMAQGSP